MHQALTGRGHGAGRGLCRVNAEKRIRVLAVHPQEGRTLASERVHLLGLPLRELLEALDGAVVILETAHLVIDPDERHMTGAGLVCLLHDDSRKCRRLNGDGKHELLTRLNGNASANEQLGVLAKPRSEALHGELALGIVHRYVAHGTSFPQKRETRSRTWQVRATARHVLVTHQGEAVNVRTARRWIREFVIGPRPRTTKPRHHAVPGPHVLERATGLEPANDGLGSRCLTTWRCPRLRSELLAALKRVIQCTQPVRFEQARAACERL